MMGDDALNRIGGIVGTGAITLDFVSRHDGLMKWKFFCMSPHPFIRCDDMITCLVDAVFGCVTQYLCYIWHCQPFSL
jgi:hypothetical protein